MNLEQQWNDISVKHVNNMKLLRQVRARQMRGRRERAARKAEIQELSLQKDDLPVFRSVGKAFILASKAELEQEAQAGLTECAANEEKFENQAQFLMKKVKENEQQMGELMRQQNSGR